MTEPEQLIELIAQQRRLIGELADALAHFHPQSLEYNELIRRAKEVAQ